MNIRLRGIIGLTVNYSMLLAFGVLFAAGLNYLLNDIVNTVALIVTMMVINTITMKHMRCYWKDIIYGNRTTYFNDRPGFTNEIIDAPKKEPEKFADLKGSLLDD